MPGTRKDPVTPEKLKEDVFKAENIRTEFNAWFESVLQSIEDGQPISSLDLWEAYRYSSQLTGRLNRMATQAGQLEAERSV